MLGVTAKTDLIAALNELFTRSYYSASGYVFESQPFTHADDEDVLNLLLDMRRRERQHARMLAQIVESLDRVPEAGAFPYWYRDLNYLTVPFLAHFVVEALETDIRLFDATIAMAPPHLGLARTMLESIKVEKVRALEELRPLAATARAAEAKRYVDEAAALKTARAARIKREKAAADAAKSAAPATAGLPDPDEAGITNKEKARRVVAIIRARKSGALPTAAAGPSLAEAALAAGVLDPDEEGLTSKEKGKRKVLFGRFKKKWEAEQAAGGGAAAVTAGPSLTEAALAAGVLDPDEEGLTSKEKGKRKVLFGRFKKKWESEQG